MAGSAVTSLLEKLSRLRMPHAHLIYGIHKELKLLEIDLSGLKESLLEHDGDDGEDERSRVVKIEIKELVYQVEDCIDAYYTLMAAPKVKNFFSNWKMKTMLIERIRRIELDFSVLSSRCKQLFKTGNPEGIHGAKGPTTTLAPIRIDNVMGRDDEEKTIISYLMESREELGVISIEGEAGLGKTTLARRIYVNTKVAHEFPVRIWINCVHYNFELDVDDILRNILRVFTSQDIDSLSHEELSENVVACLDKKKFLLVLDNMPRQCDRDHLRAIQNVLSKSDGMGKVLIAARNSRVGWSADFSMRLLTLDPMDSWELLQLKVFGDLKRCPPMLESIGRSIANKCDGIPLQIILVGGILMGELMKSNIPNTIKEVKVFENVHKDLGKGMHDVLELAYSRLSDELCQCFLYMGVFPEDYEISAWTLTRLWIAEGFVRPMEGHSLEEAATQNLDHLIRRGLVMVDKMNPFGKAKTCHVYDIINSFIMKKGLEQELFTRLSLDHYPNKCRRLCVHSNADLNLLSRVPKSSGVRSVLWFNESPTGLDPNDMSTINESPTGLDPNDMSTILNTFHLLKVWDSKSIKFHKLPQQITKLFHLRYVTLSVDDLNILPKSLSKLWNLETLVVDTKSRVITMEANIWRLIWLRHLKTNAAIVLSSNNEDQSLAAGGENLQTLTRLSPESCTSTEVSESTSTEVSKRACNLKSLGIRGDLEILFGKEFLERLNNLEKLKLIHDVIPKISSENPLPQLHPPNRFPPNLKWLTLSQTHLLWDRDMPTLANIKTLEVLKLKDDAFTGVIWRESGDCFPRLKFFLIETTDLVIWEASTESLPRLSCLVLKNCENLREIPEAVAENLKTLEIEHLGNSAVDSAWRIADRKQQAQEKEKSDCPFKLSIGPGCY